MSARPRVLVIESNPTMRRVLEEVLATHVDIVAPAPGAKAPGGPAFDAAILGVDPPFCDGAAGMELLETEHPETAIVLLAPATARAAEATSAFSARCAARVPRPALTGHVAAVMRSLNETLAPIVLGAAGRSMC